MEIEHLLHVHLVNVVAAEHEHVVGVFIGDDVEGLIDGVGGAFEPFAASTLLRGHGFDVLIEHRGQTPTPCDVAVERVAHVLREHLDFEHAGIDQIRQHKIDQPIAASDRHGRFGAVRRERPEASPLATRQHERQKVLVLPATRGKFGSHAGPPRRDLFSSLLGLDPTAIFKPW